MKHLVLILAVVVLGVGLTVGLGSVQTGSRNPAPNMNEQGLAGNNDDAFDERHDTFDMEQLAGNNDDAFDERHDTFEIEGLV